MIENPSADFILGDGSVAAWWFFRDATKAHMVVDVRGGPSFSRTIVTTRCGTEWVADRLDRRWIEGHDIKQDKCRSCSFGLGA